MDKSDLDDWIMENATIPVVPQDVSTVAPAPPEDMTDEEVQTIIDSIPQQQRIKIIQQYEDENDDPSFPL